MRHALAFALLSAFLMMACAATPTPKVITVVVTRPGEAPPMPSVATHRVGARVARVIDGDTIEAEISGKLYKVRYIGIDTPETVHPEKPVEWMGKEAAAKNAELVGGKVVALEKDVSETDQYGRLLRYVWVGDLMVNAELVRLGYAMVSTYPPDVKYQGLFLAAQREAATAGRGLWGPAPAATPPKIGNCHPAYPDVCIPPPPPDLDCKDIPHRRFRVLPPDPHRFDGDHDGIGCETG